MQEPLTTAAMRALAEPSDAEDVLSQLSGSSGTTGTRSVASGSESASQLSGTGSQVSSSGKASSAGPVAAQEGVRARPLNTARGPPVAVPETRELEMPAPPGENQGGNRKAIAYLLAPAVAFMVTFNVAPALAPAFFTLPVSGKSDRRKIVLASAAAAVAAFLAVRCVM